MGYYNEKHTDANDIKVMKIEENKLRRNGEGYPDPTAYEAIKRAEAEHERERERFLKLVGCILRICELSGFHLEERLVLRDKCTGKVWY